MRERIRKIWNGYLWWWGKVRTNVTSPRLTCTFAGEHLYAVQYFDIQSHKMTLICNRCQETKITMVPKVTLAPNKSTQPEVGEH